MNSNPYRHLIPSAIRQNPICSRDDVLQLCLDLFEPLQTRFSDGCASCLPAPHAACYSVRGMGLEGFARPLWGLVPAVAGGVDVSVLDSHVQGLRHGPDPDHPEFWGKAWDCDQRLVEYGTLGYALLLGKEALWDALDPEEQQRLAGWLDRINHVAPADNNWLFFRALANLGLHAVGETPDLDRLEKDMVRLNEFYRDEGWYVDGVNKTFDYYNPFAFHYYGLLTAHFGAGTPCETYADRFRERARLIAPQFAAWFGVDGAALPYGRSLTYRFAMSAFWSACAYAGEEVLPWGQIKGLVLRNLRWWTQRPIFHGDGVLGVGYGYPNLQVAETYNGPGAPYWAFKTFLCLALPEAHPFWQAEEELVPCKNDGVTAQSVPGFLFCRTPEAGHAVAVGGGDSRVNIPGTQGKYRKFAWSSGCGFAVPVRGDGSNDPGGDSTLLFEDDRGVAMAYPGSEERRMEGQQVHLSWSPASGISVDTWLMLTESCHVRVHRVTSDRAVRAFEGGWSLDASDHTTDGNWLQRKEQGQALALSANGVTSAVFGLTGYNRVDLSPIQVNSHLYWPLSIHPRLGTNIKPGVHWLACVIPHEVGDVDAWMQSLRSCSWQQHGKTWQVTIAGHGFSGKSC